MMKPCGYCDGTGIDPDSEDEPLDFGTKGHDFMIHIVDGRWHGPATPPKGEGQPALCGATLHRQLKSILGKERRVCQDCNEIWLS